jgi:PAS domain S-box-containing protein
VHRCVGANTQVVTVSHSRRYTAGDLEASDQALRALWLFESCADGLIYATVDGTVQMANMAAASMFGCSRSEAVGRPLSSFRPPAHWARQREILVRLRAGNAFVGLEIVGLRRDGTEFPMSVTFSPVTVPARGVVAVSAVIRDLSALGTAQEDGSLDKVVRMSPALSRVQASLDASLVIVGTTIVFASTSALDMLGADSPAAVVGSDVVELVERSWVDMNLSREKQVKSRTWPRPDQVMIMRVDGQPSPVELASTPVRWEGHPATQIVMWNPPDSAEQMRQLATGVRTDVADAVVIVDTDSRIQSFNPAAEQLYGWPASEAIGKWLEEVIPWLASDADLAAARRELRDEGRWHGRALHCCRDGGVVNVLASMTQLTDSSGRTVGSISVNRASSEDPSEHVDMCGSPALREEIRRGLVNDEFTVHYQPVVRLDDGTPVGVEALARWNHPTRGLLLPAEFIDEAERSGLICGLGEVVLEKACAQAQLWRTAGLKLHLSVNVSTRQLADERLSIWLADLLARTEMHPEELWLEITETALVQDFDQARAGLRQIDQLGVHVSIDDFGTGWASLSYLREFPVHALKIDRVFVDGFCERPNDLAIVKSIIGLGRELGLEVVAEGISTLDQRALLYQLGCEIGQGYLFGVPRPPEQLFGEADQEEGADPRST